MLKPWSAEVAVPIRKIRTLAMELTSQVEAAQKIELTLDGLF